MKKKLIFFALALVLLPAGGAWAGWITQEAGTTQNLNAIYFRTNIIGFCVGNSGTILKTVNSGNSWEAKNSGTANYNDVFFPAAAEGYVLGDSGKFLKSTDGGDTYADALPLTAPLTTANFKKGSALGDQRAVAANTGAASDGYLLTSTTAGASWASTAQTNLAVDGVLLASGEGGAVNTWLWGKFYAGADAGKYAIIKNGATVYTNASNGVRDVFFVDTNTGYAVGDNGLLLKTTAGGDSGEWSDLTSASVTTKNLKAVWFITTNFGWIIGEQGLIALTTDGGTAWNEYLLDAGLNLNDLYVRATVTGTTASVFAFLAGNTGKIFKLASPKLTSFQPTSRNRGWIGTVTVTGEGFAEGATLSFSNTVASAVDAGPGVSVSFVKTQAADPRITVVSTSVESSTLLKATIIIGVSAEAGPSYLTITNLDATSTSESSGLNITTAESVVTISNIWLDNNKYLEPSTEALSASATLIPRITINQQPTLSFTVTSSNNQAASISVRTILEYSGQYIFSFFPASALTVVSPTQVNVSYKIPELFPKGVVVTYWIYAEDKDGNLGFKQLLVAVAQEAQEGTPGWNPTPPKGTKPGLEAVVNPVKNTYDPESDPQFSATLLVTPGKSYNDFIVKITDNKGTLYFSGPYSTNSLGANAVTTSQIVTAKGIVTKQNFSVQSANIPHNILTPGIYLMHIIDPKTNSLIAKTPFVILPKALRP